MGTATEVRFLHTGDGLRVEAMTTGKCPQALLTMKNLAHTASFWSPEKDAPSNPGTKHLGFCGAGDCGTNLRHHCLLSY